MTKDELQSYLRAHIPLTRAMEVAVSEASRDCVILKAPLAPNTNHRDTAFGGSVVTLAILAAWSLLRIRLADILTSDTHLVIQRNSMEFLKPISGEFTAQSKLPEKEKWTRFEAMLAARGKARISIGVEVDAEGELCARFEGEFVALKQVSSAK